ncbi:isoleucine--tRNA ligase [Hyphomicrobiales bacterium]|nr:isoleucine--tRNA ligase [Hyphomicrobiales bacterium]
MSDDNIDNIDKVDYKDSLLLPKTDLPMRANLPEREPGFLEVWKKNELFSKLRESSTSKEKFILHDGPPYANGNLHMGTALNKILKDVIVRSRQLDGFDAEYRPGWDCHGLPIEWKVEEKFRDEGKNKEEIPINDFRNECRLFAKNWIEIQKKQFMRLGILGNWSNPYTTMEFSSESIIVKEFHKFLMSGDLYRGSKPVMWSVVEKTALAEAEVEYLEHASPTIWVNFPIQSNDDDLVDSSILIWTTTPWTIPANRAVAYSSKFQYGLYKVSSTEEGSLATLGKKIIINSALKGNVEKASKSELTFVKEISSFDNMLCSHPFKESGYDFDIPILEGDFLTEDAGTGFVHIAPSHGQDDYELAIKNGIEPPFILNDEGVYLENVKLFAGKRVYNSDGTLGDATGSVISELINSGNLFGKGKLRHQYPHSWRSKAPLIFRNTPQWFISMEKNGLRDKSLKAIEEVQWIPGRGKNRIKSMVESRPDWVVSRQRAWGVPLAIFVNKETGQPLKDQDVNDRISKSFEKKGSDAWFDIKSDQFLGDKYNSDEWEKVNDILDVWFDSGSTHAFVLEGEDGLGSPANLYLEGSDQHRGWFQSSLLESCGTRGKAPFKQVLTHGFVMDKDGRKMSKSLGNVILPDDLIDQYGADVVRLWVVSSDFTEDLRVGQEIMKANVESYRKIRNTFRFLLGNLHEFKDEEIVPYNEMPELEKYILHKLSIIDEKVKKNYREYDLKSVFQDLLNFSNLDLSSFYFDIRKDTLYCDSPNSLSRRATRTVLDIIFNYLVVWFSPILCFTTEEVLSSRFPNNKSSIHESSFSEVNEEWNNKELFAKWEKIRSVRKVVTGAIELERQEKRIGSSLEAFPTVFISDKEYLKIFSDIDLAEIFITSQAILEEGDGPSDAFRLDEMKMVSVECNLSNGRKCNRSWKILPEVGTDPDYPDLSIRDADVMREISG